jgi:hypothetical protein
VSARLYRIQQAQDDLVAAAEAYYSEPKPKLEHLWHLVPAGRTLLRRNKTELPLNEFWAKQLLLLREHPLEGNRRMLLEQAELQAGKLLRRFWEAWLDASPSEAPPQPPPAEVLAARLSKAF